MAVSAINPVWILVSGLLVEAIVRAIYPIEKFVVILVLS